MAGAENPIVDTQWPRLLGGGGGATGIDCRTNCSTLLDNSAFIASAAEADE